MSSCLLSRVLRASTRLPPARVEDFSRASRLPKCLRLIVFGTQVAVSHIRQVFCGTRRRGSDTPLAGLLIVGSGSSKNEVTCPMAIYLCIIICNAPTSDPNLLLNLIHIADCSSKVRSPRDPHKPTINSRVWKVLIYNFLIERVSCSAVARGVYRALSGICSLAPQWDASKLQGLSFLPGVDVRLRDRRHPHVHWCVVPRFSHANSYSGWF